MNAHLGLRLRLRRYVDLFEASRRPLPPSAEDLGRRWGITRPRDDAGRRRARKGAARATPSPSPAPAAPRDAESLVSVCESICAAREELRAENARREKLEEQRRWLELEVAMLRDLAAQDGGRR